MKIPVTASMFGNRILLRLRSLLRPRGTWTYLLGFGITTYSIYCLLFSSPLLSSRLPAYTGPHAVGTIDLEIPCQPRTINPVRFKDTGHHAFRLETVLFTLYYPSNKGVVSSKDPHLWIPRPLGVVGAGYARFARISNLVTDAILTLGLWTLVGSTTIPAQVDVPLHHPSVVLPQSDAAVSRSATVDGFPVLLFSHGFASSRTQYTQYCGELASRGHVVAAIEHRDGSGPGTVIMRKHAEDKHLLHFSRHHLSQDAKLDSAAFRQLQLDFRQAEVEEIVQILRRINEGMGDEIFTLNSRGEGQHLGGWQGRLAMNKTSVGGHSFGATLALQTLRNGPSESLPFRSAVILDPGKQSGRLNDDIHVSTLIINSNSWSKRHSVFFGRPHFDVVKNVAQQILRRGQAAWFLTSLGTSHPSVTDAPLLEPLLLSWTTGSTIDAHEGVQQYVEISERFLQYQRTRLRTGLLSECVTHPEYDVEDSKRDDSGDVASGLWKYWQLHVAPCSTEAGND